MKRFGLRLAVRMRFTETGKWPITKYLSELTLVKAAPKSYSFPSKHEVDKSLSERFNLCKDFSISSFTNEYAHSNHS